MAINPITTPLPADLPTNWTYGQTVAPTGGEAGLSTQYGYNYLMEQVNAAQVGVNTIGSNFANLASLDSSGVLKKEEIPNIDCGTWDSNSVALHNITEHTHTNLVVDGNVNEVIDNSTTLETHIVNASAHQNLSIDGNNQ